MTIRSFIALVPDEASRAALSRHSRNIKALYGFDGLRFIDPFCFHLTLAFLDQQKGEALKDIADTLDEGLNTLPTVSEATISHTAYFPLGKQPKVLAAMIKPCETLSKLQKRVVDVIPNSFSNFSKIRQQAKRFTPHISLARLNHHAFVSSAIHVETKELVKFSELAIFESVLTPDGPIYKPLHEWSVHQIN